MKNKHEVTWLDGGREATQPANPKFPKGIHVDFSKGETPTCWVQLPYPAPRCGSYLIQCKECNLSVMITTAGRKDDPKSIRMACLHTVH